VHGIVFLTAMCRSASIAPSEKNWVHCRPRPGSAVLIGVAFRRGLTGSTVKRATRPPWLCILCQRACRNAQARISPNKKDDATTTAKQTGVHTLQHFLVDVLNGVPRRNSGRALRSFPAFAASDAPNVIGPQGKRSGFYHRVGCIGTHARARVRSGMCSRGLPPVTGEQRDRPAAPLRFVAVR
jgi:hypothetical protein